MKDILKQRERRAFFKHLKKYHTGKDNVITCKELHRELQVSESTVRGYVVSLRKSGIPICSCRYGYYYPESHTDVLETVTRFNKYLLTLSATNTYLIKATI